MKLDSLDGCKLTIGSFPAFSYDARGGGGEATIVSAPKTKERKIIFNAKTFYIPALNHNTTKILGLKLPIGIQIKIEPIKLEGTLNMETAELKLYFDAEFKFCLFELYQGPALSVKTILSNKSVKNSEGDSNSSDFFAENKVTIEGTAMIPKTNNPIFDYFLGLPNEATAKLKCILSENNKHLK